MSDDISERILNFLDSAIDSVELLEVLLLIYSNPDKAWSKNEITTILRSTEASITKRLNDLYQRGVLLANDDQHDLHTFKPANEEIKKTIIELEKLYKSKSYKVIDAIYSRTHTKKIRAFANAFILRGDKK
jgi:hypothetical protein